MAVASATSSLQQRADRRARGVENVIGIEVGVGPVGGIGRIIGVAVIPVRVLVNQIGHCRGYGGTGGKVAKIELVIEAEAEMKCRLQRRPEVITGQRRTADWCLWNAEGRIRDDRDRLFARRNAVAVFVLPVLGRDVDIGYRSIGSNSSHGLERLRRSL